MCFLLTKKKLLNKFRKLIHKKKKKIFQILHAEKIIQCLCLLRSWGTLHGLAEAESLRESEAIDDLELLGGLDGDQRGGGGLRSLSQTRGSTE